MYHGTQRVTANKITQTALASSGAVVPPIPSCFLLSCSDMTALKPSSPRVLAIGLDAISLPFVRANEACLPTLAALLDSNRLVRLNTPGTRLAGSVWPTFFTASGPGHHGIYHHLQWDRDSMRLRRLSPKRDHRTPFWVELDRAGLKCCVIDVPMMFPNALRHGLEVVHWTSHDQLDSFSCSRPDVGAAEEGMASSSWARRFRSRNRAGSSSGFATR